MEDVGCFLESRREFIGLQTHHLDRQTDGFYAADLVLGSTNASTLNIDCFAPVLRMDDK